MKSQSEIGVLSEGSAVMVGVNSSIEIDGMFDTDTERQIFATKRGERIPPNLACNQSSAQIFGA